MKLLSPGLVWNETASIRSRLVDHARTPLYRDAYALILNQATAAVLGMAYWLLVARLFSPEVVGQNVAVLSTTMLLAAFAELSLTAAAVRFVPRAAARTARLVTFMYAATLVAAALGGVAYFVADSALGLDAGLPNDSSMIGWVTLSAMVWCIFRIQDGVLIGMRRATWVFIENTVFNVSKMLLIVGVWALGPFPPGAQDYSVVFSWFVPVPFVVLLVNAFIFGRFLRVHVKTSQITPDPITYGKVAGSSGADYVGSLVSEAAVRILPLLAITLAGTSASAFFYQSWVVITPIFAVFSSLASSFTVEAAGNLGQIVPSSRRILRHMALVAVPIVAGVGACAPLILGVFGADYAREGAATLRWLTLSVLPNVLNTWYLSYARVRGDMASVIQKQVVLCVMALGLSYLLLPTHGITGIGEAWFVGQSVVAFIVALEVAPLLRKETSGETQTGMPLNRLIRRADWRFLAGCPNPELSAVFAQGLLAKSVAAVSVRTVEGNSAPRNSCDLAVVASPNPQSLESARTSLREGGICYGEWASWRSGGTLGIRRMLRSAGFSHVRVYWPYPGPDTARFWLPIPASDAAIRYLVNHLPMGQGAIRNALAVLTTRSLKLVLGLGLVPCLCALAFKGDAGARDLATFIGEASDEEQRGGTSERRSILLQTPGNQLRSKIICMVFVDKDPSPRWVVKLPRVPEDSATILRERDVLDRLNRNGDSAGGLVFPPIKACADVNGVTTSVQRALVGPPLQDLLKGDNFAKLAEQVTDWQIALAKQSIDRGEGVNTQAMVSSWMVRLQSEVSQPPDDDTVAETLQRASSLGTLPSVCAHNDFAPWNLIQTRDGLGAIDWSDADWNGLPMLDLVYVLSNMAFVLEGAWDPDSRVSVYQGLLDPSTSTGDIFHSQLDRYARAVGIRKDQIAPLRLLTWVFHTSNEYNDAEIENASGDVGYLKPRFCLPLWKAELETQLPDRA